jgi:hypothetical protein
MNFPSRAACVQALILLPLLLSTTAVRAACLAGNENTAVVASTPSAAFELGAAAAAQDGIVVHTPTRLQWMRCALGQQWNGVGCAGAATPQTWAQALAAAAASTHGGFTDWRLPSRSELASLVEQRCHSPAINLAVFPQTPPQAFVTASPHAVAVDPGIAGSVWVVAFDEGDVIADESSRGYAVRLVRGGRWEP